MHRNAQGLARVLDPAGLLGAPPAVDRPHAQPAQRLAEVGHADLAVMLQHEHVHHAAVGIQERRAHAGPSLRSGGALEQREQRLCHPPVELVGTYCRASFCGFLSSSRDGWAHGQAS